jgi:hypothetical protein
VLHTDSSNHAVGAVLNQLVPGVLQPLSFFSQKLSPLQSKYRNFDCELLSIYLSKAHFHHLLEGHYSTILTDHKPLVYAFKTRQDKHCRREFHLSILHGHLLQQRIRQRRH